jgi:acyl-CoA synthetase (NDP forming)
MLEARTVAIVGASARPGSFGERLVREVTRSPSGPTVHLVNPRYDAVLGRPCLHSLDDVPGPVDLVLLGVGDRALEAPLAMAAARGDRAAVVFGSAWSPPSPPSPDEPPLGERLARTARKAGMALCGAGCMGFVNVARGLRAIGYLERPHLPGGPVAFVSHSGSAFSALLRSHRGIGFSLAVSAGQELVTTTADYLDYALGLDETRVVALLLETVREPERLRAALDRAAGRDIPVALLAVGGTPAGTTLVSAHSGALAGSDAAWEALVEAHGLLRVDDLDEMADLLELLAAGRRVSGVRASSGIATVHDSGAERVLVADVAHRLGVPFAALGEVTNDRLAGLLDPGLVPGNPLDVWGRGADTRELFASCLTTLAEDEAVSVVALAVDLVTEYDGDESYPLAALDAHAATSKPVVVLSNMASALDQRWAARLRESGVPVLEGTRSGLRALGHLLDLGDQRGPVTPVAVDPVRRDRWLTRLAAGPLSTIEAFAMLRDYGLATVEVAAVSSRDDAVAAARAIGWPVVLKTDEGVAHKWEVGGVRLGLLDVGGVAAAYDDLAARLGPRAVVSASADAGTELVLGITTDPMLGPLVVLGAGGVLVEVLRDRVVALPPLDLARAERLVNRLGARPMLDGVRGAPPADLPAVWSSVCALGRLAVELGDRLAALDVNPVIAGPHGAVAVDVLVVPRPAPPPALPESTTFSMPADGSQGVQA